MAYVDLKKLFFSQKDQYLEIYHNRFNSESTIHLPLSINNIPAFCVITPDILYLVTEIFRLNGQLFPLRKLLPEPALAQYRNTCLINEITLTNDIENVHSSRREISDLLNDLEQKDTRKRFRGLVNKYVMLLTNEERKLQTCQDIRSIFDEMVANEIQSDSPDCLPDGKIFRKDSVTVYSQTDKPIHHGVYPEANIIEMMEQSLQFLNDKSVNILLRISIFHYLFGYIHPFYDGNGRVSRFISSYLLADVLDPLVSFHLSLTLKNQLSAYYKAFETCNDARNLGDLTPFVLMFLDVIKQAIEELYADLHDRIQEWQYHQNLADKYFQNANSKVQNLVWYLIQASLFSEDGISTQDLLKCLKISTHSTLRRYLDLIPENMLKTKALQGNTKFYQLNLSILQNSQKNNPL